MKLFKLMIYSLIGLLLISCGSTRVTSREMATKAPYQLTSVTIVWQDNAALPYEVIRLGYSGYYPKIDESDKAHAKIIVSNLNNAFRKSAVQQIREQLTQKNIADGKNVVTGKGVFLSIAPIKAKVVVGGIRNFIIRASIKEQPNSKEIWSVTIDAFVHTDKTDETLVENYVKKLIAELRDSGWIA